MRQAKSGESQGVVVDQQPAAGSDAKVTDRIKVVLTPPASAQGQINGIYTHNLQEYPYPGSRKARSDQASRAENPSCFDEASGRQFQHSVLPARREHLRAFGPGPRDLPDGGKDPMNEVGDDRELPVEIVHLYVYDIGRSGRSQESRFAHTGLSATSDSGSGATRPPPSCCRDLSSSP